MHATTHTKQATLFRLLVTIALVASAFITTAIPAYGGGWDNYTYVVTGAGEFKRDQDGNTADGTYVYGGGTIDGHPYWVMTGTYWRIFCPGPWVIEFEYQQGGAPFMHSGTPDPAPTGTYSGSGGTCTVSLTSSNAKPTVSDVSKSVNEDTGINFTETDFSSRFSDTDGDSLSKIQVTSLPLTGALTLGGIPITLNQEIPAGSLGTLTFDPTANWNGATSFGWNGSDGAFYAESGAHVNITVDPINDAPVNRAPANQSVSEDTALTFSSGTQNQISVSDVDVAGDDLKVSLSVISGTLTLNGTNGLSFSQGDGTSDAAITFTGTMTDCNSAMNGMTYQGNQNHCGSDPLTVLTDDQGHHGGAAATMGTDRLHVGGSSLTDQDTVVIWVLAINDAPDAVDDSGVTVEDVAVTIDVLANDSDVENDPLTVIQVTDGALGKVTNNGDGTVTYTPTPGKNGVDTFTYTITDLLASTGDSIHGILTTDTGTVNVVIEDVNDLPVAVDDAATVPADRASDIMVLDNDSDPDGDNLRITEFTQLAHGTLEAFDGGIMRYTPDAGYTGPDGYSYTITDNNDEFDSADVSITVSAEAEAQPADMVFQAGAGGYFGSSDTFIDLGNPGTAWGGADRLRVKTTQNADALVEYDLSALPAGTTVNSATLRLFVIEQIGSAPVKQAFKRTLSVPITLRAFPVLKAWDESAATWYAATGLDGWGAAGCQAPGVDYASEYVDELIAFDLVQDWAEFDITELAQQWVDDPASNFGVVIKGYLHRMTVSYSFWSSQGPLPALRPQLEISYELPE